MRRMVLLWIGVLMMLVAIAQEPGDRLAWLIGKEGSRVRVAGVTGMRLELRGIYVHDGLLWFQLRVHNSAVLDWRAGPMRFVIRDRRVWRRRARQELSLPVVVRREGFWVRSDSTVNLWYGLAPRLPGRGQDLVLEYGERNGDRRMFIKVDAKDILKAKKIN